MTSYKDCGVDIELGNALVEGLKPLAKSTFDSRVIGGLGSFAGAYALPSGYKNPILLAATDGVGTKLKLAIESKKLDSIGIDLVAMCVNDLICNFALPMFFLDYYATGKLDKDSALAVIGGIAKGCKEAECALIGGESAEMPDMYQKGDFDLAGFAVGIAEKEVLEQRCAQKGDVLIALPSSGIHSNGYSLVRKLLFSQLKMDFWQDFEGRALIDVLLEPTIIYVKCFKRIFASHISEDLHALAHITGGGIIENLPRILPQNLSANIEKRAIKTPPIFGLFSKYVEQNELWRTFNMGVGMVLVADSKSADTMLDLAKDFGAYIIGEVVESSAQKVRIA